MQNTEVSTDGCGTENLLALHKHSGSRLAAGLSFPAKYHQSKAGVWIRTPVTEGRLGLEGMGGGLQCFQEIVFFLPLMEVSM